MKTIFFAAAVIASLFTKPDTDVVDKLGVKGPLTFNKTAFNLAWVSNPNSNYYVQEYLPKNENETHFNQMLSVFLLVGNTKTEDAVKQKTEELAARKSTDPTCNFIVNKSADGKEFILDFVLGENNIEEFNIYRYKQIDVGSRGKAILMYAYSKRAYGNNITAFLQNLKTERTKLLNEMAAAPMPPVTLSNR